MGNKYKKERRIVQGGMTATTNNSGRPTRIEQDIILQMPTLFFFDMNSYMQSINAAKAIDFYSRWSLYDMYESALFDLHLRGIIDKRLIGVSRIPIEFRRNGKPDEEINKHIRSPWFRRFVKDVLWSKFWGFSLFQFYRDGDWISYDLIPRKHYDPVKKQLLKNQSDSAGLPIEAFSNMLWVGEEPRGLGILAELVPMVLYKRGDFADWAQFCQIFGMPIREYTYDAGDEETRKRLIADARRQGANAVYIHPKESSLNLIESANKSGTVDLYERFKDSCNSEMSVRVLGNTLTTDSKANGTQALGVVHQEEENELKADDRDFVLDVLNYDMADIFDNLNIDTTGGEFVYLENKRIKPSEQIEIVQKLHQMGLPMSDDYLYETFHVDKPADYEDLKAAKEKEKIDLKQQKELYREQLAGLRQPEKGTVRNLTDRLKGFFGEAPQKGASSNSGTLPW